MKNKILKIIHDLDTGNLTGSEAEKKVLDLFSVSNNEVAVCGNCEKVLIGEDYEENKCAWCGTAINQSDC